MKYTKHVGLLLMAGLVFSGCGKKEHTIVTPGGSVTVTEQKGDQVSATIKTEEGTVNYEVNKKVDFAALGIPEYPGAKTEAGGSFAMSGGKDNKQVTSVNFSSTDPQEKVAQFYKDHFKNKKPTVMDMSSDGKKTTQIMVKENKQTTHLMIMEEKDKTVVNVYKGSE